MVSFVDGVPVMQLLSHPAFVLAEEEGLEYCWFPLLDGRQGMLDMLGQVELGPVKGAGSAGRILGFQAYGNVEGEDEADEDVTEEDGEQDQ